MELREWCEVEGGKLDERVLVQDGLLERLEEEVGEGVWRLG